MGLDTRLLGQIRHLDGVGYTDVGADTAHHLDGVKHITVGGRYFTLTVLDTLLLGKILHLDGVGYTTVGEDTSPCTLLLGQVF